MWKKKCREERMISTYKDLSISCVRAKGRLPQHIPQWHRDYFELKLLEKQLVKKDIQKTPWPPTFPLKAGNKSCM